MAIRWRQLELAEADAEERLERAIDLSMVETFTLGPLMIERSLRAQLEETRSDDLEEVDSDDSSYYSWGEDGARMDPGRRGPFHGMLGRGGQLAIESDGDDAEAVTTVRALSTDEVEASLLAEAGDEPWALDEGLSCHCSTPSATVR